VPLADRAVSSLPPGAVRALREAKHHGAVFLKRASWGFPQYRGPLLEPLVAWRQGRNPYPFPEDGYADSWLGRSQDARPVAPGEPVPRRIFAIWSGDNDLTPQRRRNLDSVRDVNAGGAEVVLVTPDSLHEWIVPGHPLPPEYDHLSLVHRSDILRSYLLHHHGGGYSDIKQCLRPWAPSFDRLEASSHWLSGYTEVHRLNIPFIGGELERDVRRASRQVLGCGAMIARARTPFTGEWLTRVGEVLAANAEALRRHPGNVRGDNAGYPLAWTEVLAHVVAPLTWKYQRHLIHDEDIRPSLKRYL
jgi:hypothetical protein